MSSTTRSVKVASVQAAPVGFDLPATLAKVSELVSEAASKGAQLVVLPEAFCSAYPRHWGFAIGSRSESQREWYGKYVKSAVAVPEDAVGRDWLSAHSELKGTEEFWGFSRLCDTARTARVYLSIGIIERSIIGSTLWCSNLLFSPSGVLLSKHRKLQPTAAERIVWSQGEGTYPVASPSKPEADDAQDGQGQSSGGGLRKTEGRRKGDNMPVVSTEIGRVGGLICWENFMPLARYVLYKKGVEIYTAPTADARPTWSPVMQHIAQEGRCFVVSANQYHTSKDFPADYPASPPPPQATAPAPSSTSNSASTTASSQAATNGHASGGSLKAQSGGEQAWSRGGSCIVDPLGRVLAGPLWDQEGILYAELDLDLIHGAKLDFDPIGHYAREELMMGLLSDLS